MFAARLRISATYRDRDAFARSSVTAFSRARTPPPTPSPISRAPRPRLARPASRLVRTPSTALARINHPSRASPRVPSPSHLIQEIRRLRIRQPILRLPIRVRVLQQSAQFSRRERRHVLDHRASFLRQPIRGRLRIFTVLDEDRRRRHRGSSVRLRARRASFVAPRFARARERRARRAGAHGGRARDCAARARPRAGGAAWCSYEYGVSCPGWPSKSRI